MALQLYKIATVEVGSAGAASIDFTSIPQGYTDLKLVLSGRINNASTTGNSKIQFNGSSTSYSCKILYGGSGGPGSGSDTVIYNAMNGNTSTANAFASIEFYIPNYAGSTNKSVSIDGVTENNSSDAQEIISAGLWSNTAAITSIAVTSYSVANFMQYTTATLYGIL